MEILRYPDPKLRQKSKEFHFIPGWKVKLNIISTQLIISMGNDLGLAAPQVGLDTRMFVTSLRMPHKIIINPRWEPSASGKSSLKAEGCLSFPGWIVPVKRFDSITTNYYNAEGEQVKSTLHGIAAQVFQHETDHLDGVLLIDHLTEAQKATIEAAIAARSE